MRYSVFVYIYALRGFVLNDPERWYGFMSFAERLRDNSPYDYEEENRFARRADPAANPDGFQVLLVKPSQFEEAQVIADSFGAGQVIVLNLDAAARDIARRVLDFLSGAAYARNCTVEHIANNTYLIRNADSVSFDDADGIYSGGNSLF